MPLTNSPNGLAGRKFWRWTLTIESCCEKTGTVTTNGYQVRFRRDINGKIVKKEQQEGTYRDVGVSALLICIFDV